MSESSRTEPSITTEELGEIVRIVDPELDVEAILAEIRANLASRPPLNPDPSSFVYRPGDASSISGQMEVDWHVDQASEYARGLAIGDQMQSGGGTLAPLTDRLKRPVHQLVRYYVDLLAQRQSALEGHVLAALRGLALGSKGTRDELSTLRKEVEELRERLKALEASRADPT